MKGHFLIILLIFFTYTAFTQQPIARVKHKRCLLKGLWQLAKTEVSGTAHEVSPQEFQYEIRLKSFHRYFEEVHYESEHWAITGRWHIKHRTDSLILNAQKNVIGNPGNHPKTIAFKLFLLDKNNWAGSSTAGGLPVKVYYRRAVDQISIVTGHRSPRT